MSYRNPTQAIDTQSGQHIRNLQQSVAGTFANYAKTVGDLAISTREKDAQAIKDNVARQNLDSAKYNKSIEGAVKIDSDHPTVNLSSLQDWMEMTSSINSNSSASVGDRKIAAHMALAGETLKKTMVGYMADQQSYVDAANLVEGTPGATSKTVSQENGKFWRAYYKIGDQAGSSVEGVFNPSENGLNTRFRVSDANGNFLKEVNPNDPSTFPPDKRVVDIRETVADIRKTALADIDFKNAEDPIYAKSVKVKGAHNSKNNQTEWGIRPDIETFKGKIRKSVEAYVLGGMTAGEAMELQNNMFAESDDSNDLGSYTPNWRVFTKKQVTEKDPAYVAQKEVQEKIIGNLVDHIADGTNGLKSFLKTDTVKHDKPEGNAKLSPEEEVDGVINEDLAYTLAGFNIDDDASFDTVTNELTLSEDKDGNREVVDLNDIKKKLGLIDQILTAKYGKSKESRVIIEAAKKAAIIKHKGKEKKKRKEFTRGQGFPNMKVEETEVVEDWVG
jgi:hypothetical protein